MRFVKPEIRRIANSYAKFFCRKMGIILPPPPKYIPDDEFFNHDSTLCQACKLNICHLDDSISQNTDTMSQYSNTMSQFENDEEYNDCKLEQINADIERDKGN